MEGKRLVAYDVTELVKRKDLMPLTVKETAKELGKSTRTVFRMIKDGRLKAVKVYLPNETFIWVIEPMSIARIQVRKEFKEEEKNNPSIRNRNR